MPDPDLPTAVRRLERAVLRLEGIGPGTPAGAIGCADLRARHERLRARVADAIGALDAVIGSADRPA